jgi:UDP-N-acetylglucosamine 4-epimerase
VIEANILAATIENKSAVNQVYNVGVGGRTTMKELFFMIRGLLGEYDRKIKSIEPNTGSFRPGDVRHSKADISKAKTLLGYLPSHTVKSGMKETVEWFVHRITNKIV